MYLLNVKYMYRILYLICLKKTESTLSKKEKKKQKQKEKKRKEKHFFLFHLLLNGLA